MATGRHDRAAVLRGSLRGLPGHAGLPVSASRGLPVRADYAGQGVRARTSPRAVAARAGKELLARDARGLAACAGQAVRAHAALGAYPAHAAKGLAARAGQGVRQCAP